MKRDSYNLVVIGGGAAGLVASYVAANAKAKVALIEKHKMGGDCLNTGCVPSKSLIRAGKIAQELRQAHNFGVSPQDVKVDFAMVMERIRSVQKEIEPHDSMERFTKLGVECIKGEATILDPYRVSVGERILQTRAIILATGSTPAVPAFTGLETIKFFTSDTIWSLETLPQQLLVLGGGTIGVELAQAFARLGSKVTLVERNERILNREDSDVSDCISASLQNDGVKILTQAQVESFRQAGDKGLGLLRLRSGEQKEIAFDSCLIALGRKPNVSGFGLSLELDQKGTLATDALLRTNIPNIFACGDVAGPFQFTHMASYQAGIATLNALFKPFVRLKPSYKIVPAVTFSDPELARVGLSRSEAEKAGLEFDEFRYELSDLDRAIIEGDRQGFVKVLTKKGTDQIIGATILGAKAGELLMPFVLAMHQKFGLKEIFSAIYPYPILGEANRFVAAEWRKKNIPHWVYRLLEIFHRFRR